MKVAFLLRYSSTLYIFQVFSYFLEVEKLATLSGKNAWQKKFDFLGCDCSRVHLVQAEIWVRYELKFNYSNYMKLEKKRLEYVFFKLFYTSIFIYSRVIFCKETRVNTYSFLQSDSSPACSFSDRLRNSLLCSPIHSATRHSQPAK